MKVTRLVKRFPFTFILLIGFALRALSDQLGVQYDSGGPESLLFYLSLLLTFPVWIAHEALFSSELTRTFYISQWVPALIGLVIALAFDYSISLLRAAARRD